jgi:hypothetical protein
LRFAPDKDNPVSIEAVRRFSGGVFKYSEQKKTTFLVFGSLADWFEWWVFVQFTPVFSLPVSHQSL